MPRRKDPRQFFAAARAKGSEQSREGIDGTEVRKRLEPKTERVYQRKVELWNQYAEEHPGATPYDMESLKDFDITPMNIMVDEHDTPIIIDFGSCQPFGSTLTTAGMPGLIDDDFNISAQKHDEIALGKIRSWLEQRGSSS